MKKFSAEYQGKKIEIQAATEREAFFAGMKHFAMPYGYVGRMVVKEII